MLSLIHCWSPERLFSQSFVLFAHNHERLHDHQLRLHFFLGLGSLWLDLSSLLQYQSRVYHLHTLILYHPSQAQAPIGCITQLKRVLHSPPTNFAAIHENLRSFEAITRADSSETRSKTFSTLPLLRKQMFCNPACVRLKNARFAVTFKHSTAEKGPRVHRTNCAVSKLEPAHSVRLQTRRGSRKFCFR